MKRVLVAGVLGGLTVFIWGAISWMALPWHNATMPQMPGGATVSQALADMNMSTGVYAYPIQENAGQTAVAESQPAEPAESAEPAEAEMAEKTAAAMESAGEGAESAAKTMAEGAETAASAEPAAEAVVASKEGEAVMPAATEAAAAGNKPFIFMLYVAEGFDPANMTRFVRGLVLDFVTAGLAAYLLMMVVGSLGGFRQRMTFVALIGVFAALVSHVAAWNWMMFPMDYMVVMSLDVIIGWVLAGAVIAWRIKPEASAA